MSVQLELLLLILSSTIPATISKTSNICWTLFITKIKRDIKFSIRSVLSIRQAQCYLFYVCGHHSPACYNPNVIAKAAGVKRLP